MDDLTAAEKLAAHEWMGRANFVFLVPGCFFDDVCSEGIGDASKIYRYIAEQLELAARAYRIQR
jgi:hypothetical protein